MAKTGLSFWHYNYGTMYQQNYKRSWLKFTLNSPKNNSFLVIFGQLIAHSDLMSVRHAGPTGWKSPSALEASGPSADVDPLAYVMLPGNVIALASSSSSDENRTAELLTAKHRFMLVDSCRSACVFSKLCCRSAMWDMFRTSTDLTTKSTEGSKASATNNVTTTVYIGFI